MKSKEINPIEYDNHELHIEEHIKAIINEEDEQVISRMDIHIKAHQMLMAMISGNNLLMEDNNASE